MKIKKSLIISIAAAGLILTGCSQKSEQEIFTDSVYSTAHTYDNAVISTLNDPITENLRVNIYKKSNPDATLDCNVTKLEYLSGCQSEDRLTYINFETENVRKGRSNRTNIKSARLREDDGKITPLLCRNDENNRVSFSCVPFEAFSEAKKGSVTQR